MTFAPNARHSMTFAAGVSAGITITAPSPAAAAYAASAPPAFPAVGAASVFAREIRLSAGAQVRLGIRLCTASALGAFQMRELRTFGKSRRASHTPTSLAQPRGPIFSPRNEPPEASAARRFTVQCIHGRASDRHRY